MTSSENPLSLTRDGTLWVDQDGVSFDSPANWLFTGILGGCGCGSSQELSDLAVETLRYFGTKHSERNLNQGVYNNLTMEVLAHWMDSKDLLEHGGSIGGSWLTAKGENVLRLLGSGGDHA